MLSEKTLDVEELRRRYDEERERRLQVEDRAKYTLLEGELADRYDNDPWAPTDGAREPITRDFEVVIVGGGFAGLLAAGSLRKHGIQPDELCMIERGADFGGT
jgi:cyclohexanone monooxygenase